MPIKFHSNIRNLMLGRGIKAGFAATCAISVYAGVQPTAADIAANWTNYKTNNPNFLAHYIGASWSQPSDGLLVQLTVPPPVVPINTNTATWCICWGTNVTAAAVALATLPGTDFLVGPVSNGAGTGIVRFNDTSLILGVSKAMLDGSIGATSN